MAQWGFWPTSKQELPNAAPHREEFQKLRSVR